MAIDLLGGWMPLPVVPAIFTATLFGLVGSITGVILGAAVGIILATILKYFIGDIVNTLANYWRPALPVVPAPHPNHPEPQNTQTIVPEQMFGLSITSIAPKKDTIIPDNILPIHLLDPTQQKQIRRHSTTSLLELCNASSDTQTAIEKEPNAKEAKAITQQPDHGSKTTLALSSEAAVMHHSSPRSTAFR